MQLDPNCVRAILLALESLPFRQSCTVSKLTDDVASYSKDEIEYCCLKLAEANYIEVTTVNMARVPGVSIKSIDDITFYGHEFLNNIRSNSVWNHVKSIGAVIGANSISALSQIAANVITELIKSQMDLL